MIKKNFHKTMMLLLMLVMSISGHAYDAFIDGIYYDLDHSKKKATVTYKDFDSYIDGGDYSGSVIIPATVKYEGTTYEVNSIGMNAFTASSLTSITIPNSVTSIDISAFHHSSLKSVTIPNSVISIGKNAFSYSDLTSVTLGNSLTSIGEEAFAGCVGLASLTISAIAKASPQ